MADEMMGYGLRRNGLVQFISNAELEKREREMAEATRAAMDSGQQTAGALAAHMRDMWEDAKRARQEIDYRLLYCLRAVQGKYDPEKLAAIRQMTGSEIYMMITAQKCRDAEAWILDIMQPAGDRPWQIDPTPIPELPEHITAKLKSDVLMFVYQAALAYTQETGAPVSQTEFNAVSDQFHEEIYDRTKQAITEQASKAAKRMADKIDDQLTEGNWKKVFRKFITNVVRYPIGVIKAPVLRKKKKLKHKIDPVTGEWSTEAVDTLALEFDNVNPWNIYPCSDTTDINKGGFFERHRLSRKDLNELIGVPGYKEEAIRQVLFEYGRGGLKEWLWADSERQAMEQRNPFAFQSTKLIDALQYWGSVQGSLLREWGMTEAQVPDPDIDYNIEAWLIGNIIIKAVINPHKLGHTPYFKTSIEAEPDGFWGKGIPEKIAHIQEICNATARGIVNNMGIASGPQVEVNLSRMDASNNASKIWPWKIWYAKNDQGMTNAPAVRFYQPEMKTEQLMAVYEKFKAEADNDSGIPAYVGHGDPKVGGAGNTASGLSMLMTSASRTFKGVIWNIDMDIIVPVIEALYIFNMLYDKDQKIKGDVKVKALGSSSLIAKEQLIMRRKEILAETNNPIDLQIMGIDGRRELLKEVIKSAEIPVDRVIPDPNKLPAMQAEPLPGGTQAKALPPGQGAETVSPQGEKAVEVDLAGNKAGGADRRLF